ncbi:histidine phosphatase family protein [Luteimonas vadosa]|uniref:Histidine phosphatase family protein n=1 Tax=Luteimonas vadosa TaxID=1165507 RepID=A0ABP9E752_9GAMM
MKTLLLASLAVLLAALPCGAQAAGDPPGTRTILLVRHGHYVREEGGDERTGMGLTPLGVAQAQLAGARLAGRPGHLDGLHVSPLRRARDTAAVIGESLPGRRFEVDEDLAECTPPTRRAEIMSREAPPDLAACQAQIERAFARYFVPSGQRTDLLVCHGNVIRYLVTRAMGVEPDAWLEMSVGHASLTVIRIEADGRMKVIGVGDVGHLPPNMLTGATGDAERSLAVPGLP